jgi:hypothetical protein
MYVATSTCPDIAFAVVTLSQFMWNPRKVHREASKQVLHYLKAIDNFELTLGSMDARIKAFVNADWASQPHRHSMSGYIVLLNGGPVSWSM